MTTPFPPPPATNTRSFGVKFFLIVFLALGMSLSGFFVASLTTERADHHGLLAASSDDAPAATPQPTTVLGIRLATPTAPPAARSTTSPSSSASSSSPTSSSKSPPAPASTPRNTHSSASPKPSFISCSFRSPNTWLRSQLPARRRLHRRPFTLNTEWVFRSRKLALRALAVFTALYTFIYVLLRVEAYALLVGSLASFAAVAAAMYLTRNVNWYATPAPAAATPARDTWLT